MRQATVVLSTHRPETTGLAAERMRRHDAVFLEEPPDPLFRRMLAGDLAVDDYVATLDVEYPRFSRAMCRVLREHHREGTPIHQVEPFLERLVRIHERFARGDSPGDLDRAGPEHTVYLAEHRATAALLSFYRHSASGDFGTVLESVKRFARADGRRFLVRDRMRAEALAPLIRGHSKAYIEAGQMHYALWRLLQRRVKNRVKVRPSFLMKGAVGPRAKARHLYGPGDLLTLRYIFRPDSVDPLLDLLAARALIYNKLIRKEEIDAPLETYPHTRDELHVIAAVNGLSLAACAELFSDIRGLRTDEARTLVEHRLAGTRTQPMPGEEEPDESV